MIKPIGQNCEWWSSFCKICLAHSGKCDGEEECFTPSMFDPSSFKFSEQEIDEYYQTKLTTVPH